MHHTPDITAAMTTDARDAFGTLLQRHRGIVFKVVNTYTRHPDDRNELAQEIAAQLWCAYPGYDPARGADHEANERVRALYRLIGQLEPLNRALLLLYLEDHSHREIAPILGISETNVATKISRLKQRIRTGITD